MLAILEQLKADPSLYVRKSVANNLNDISKNHPELVARIARDWYGKDERTDWIVKHGCRTLLKKGNREVMDLFGFADPGSVKVYGFALGAASVAIGQELAFSFTVETEAAAKVRLEYGIDYQKANGRRKPEDFPDFRAFFKGTYQKSLHENPFLCGRQYEKALSGHALGYADCERDGAGDAGF